MKVLVPDPIARGKQVVLVLVGANRTKSHYLVLVGGSNAD